MCASSKKGPIVQDDVLMLEGRRIMGMDHDGIVAEVNSLLPDKHISSLTFHLPDGVFILIMGAFLG